MRKCLDEGLMQSYLDDELSPGLTREATAHIARCSACVEAMASARNESGFIAQAFAPDERVPAPTERLRSRVYAAISQLEPAAAQTTRGTRFKVSALLSSLTGIFMQMPRRAAVAFASLFVAACALFFVLVQRPPSNPNAVAVNETKTAATLNLSPSPKEPPVAVKGSEPPAVTEDPPDKRHNVTIVNAGIGTPAPVQRVRMMKAMYAVPRHADTEKLLADEKQYHETIASLNKTITAGGEALLRPAVRADYERTVAVLDKAIAETRNLALRHPRDTDALNFLMSAYQSKVELLTTVANQAQVATLGR